MPTITFIDHRGNRTAVEAEAGESIMRNAVNHGVDGIEAMCGGACSCATCHVYVPNEWMDRVGKAGDDESAMLFFASGAKENSRLSCQIEVTEALDGLTLYVPEEQG